MEISATSCGIELLPKSIEFDDPQSDRNQNWYLTLSLVLSDQTKQSLLKQVVDIQNEISEKLNNAGIEATDDPKDTDKLYIYQKSTVHCSLLKWHFDSQPKSSDEVEGFKTIPIWHSPENCPIAPFEAVGRWIYAHPTFATTDFSMQLLFPRSVTTQLFQWSGFESKIYPCGLSNYSRGVVNIARFTKVGGGPVDEKISDAATAMISQLNYRSLNDPLAIGAVDTFTYVKSDAWLSNNDREIKKFTLVPED